MTVILHWFLQHFQYINPLQFNDNQELTQQPTVKYDTTGVELLKAYHFYTVILLHILPHEEHFCFITVLFCSSIINFFFPPH